MWSGAIRSAIADTLNERMLMGLCSNAAEAE